MVTRDVGNSHFPVPASVPACGLEHHRTVERFKLEETLEGHLVQLPCTEQGHLQLHQVLRAPSSLTRSVCRDGAPTKMEKMLFARLFAGATKSSCRRSDCLLALLSGPCALGEIYWLVAGGQI